MTGHKQSLTQRTQSSQSNAKPPRVKLGEVCRVVSGSTPKTSVDSYWSGPFLWITPAELNMGTVEVSETARHLSDEGVASAGLKSFPRGTVLLTSRAPIGKVAIAGQEMYCNQGFKNLICSDVINNIYLYYWLKSHTDYLNSLGRGATFKEISKSIVENIEIPLPSLPEQKRIAAVLDKICEMKRNAEARLQKLDLLVKSRFVEMFGDVKSVQKIGDLFETQSGGTPKSSGTSFYEDGDIPWLTSGEVGQGLVYRTSRFITERGLANSSAKWTPVDSVLVAMYGATAGKVGLLKIRATTNQAVCAILPNEAIVPEYLYYAVASKESWMIQQAAGGAQPNISQQVIRRMEIPIPPLILQREFAAFVAEVDKSKFVLRETLSRMETLYRAKLQEYFG